ncbi:MAG: branched-chain amino acid transport system permease protein livM [Acidimicrobiaceae bacterium]|nr:branched-chain amino acid transport system permease protein livM [Acidimicrobiaceae bacterium]
MAVSAPLKEAAAKLAEHGAARAAAGVWRHRRFGGAIRAAAGLVGLYLFLELLLRNNEPPTGIYVYGLTIGLLYSLLAIGLILIYRANRIINFAQAEMGAASAILAVLLIKVHHVPYLIAFGAAIGSGVIAGMVVEVVIVRRFAKASRLVLSVATIGIGLVFAALQFFLPQWLGGKAVDPTPPRTPLSSVKFAIGTYHLDANSVVIVFWAAVVVIGLTLFFKFTDIGIAVRGSAENADRAALLGIPVKRVSTVVWMVAAALSSLSVFLRIPVIGMPIGIFIGPVILLYGLAAAVIARMESFTTALLAGLALGVIEQTLYYFSKDPAISSALILPILLVAMLLQRNKLSRGQDTGMSTWSLVKEFRPIPPELRNVAEVQWVRLALGLGALGLLIFGYDLMGLKQQILASVVVIYGIVAVSLVILTGWAGQISLGQWGFAGIGAAVAGNLVAHHNADFFVTVVVAGVAGALAAVVIGLPALRITGLYLAVTTLAFGITVQTYFLSPTYFASFLPTHAQFIDRPLLYNRFSLVGERAFYYACLVALALCLLSARALRRSRTGRAIIAVRDNQKGAQSYGVGAAAIKLWAFAISGFWAAVAGALFAYHEGNINTAAFAPDLSLMLLIIVVIGGVTSLPGALLGTLFIGILKYGDINPGFQLLATGFGALLLLYVVPGGLAQLFYGTRDGALRWIAARKDIVVPSLVADVRTATTERERDVLSEAVATVEEAERAVVAKAAAAANGNGKSGGFEAGTIHCPVCRDEVPLAAATDHEHFKAVAAP